MKVKIYGMGWVGKAMQTLFPDALIHDPAQGLISEEPVDIAFVCVPTPLKEGVLDTSIVEEVVKGCDAEVIIIRSTVNPGTCDYLSSKYHKNIVHQPEFLGETPNHPMLEQSTRKFMILGGDEAHTRKAIEVYQTAYNANISIRQVSLYEAEVIKLTENRAIAWKVQSIQELYDACEASGVDFYTIRDAVYGDDPRFNLWFTFVFPDKRGFNSSKCLVKDVPAWASWAESMGADASMTRKLIERSDEYV